jgi:hypothetical protein
MPRLREVARAERERWKRLYRVFIGRGIEPPEHDEDVLKTDDSIPDTSAIVASVAAETAVKQQAANRALSNIRSMFHDADQPMTVAAAKTSMLKRVGHGN